jgi:hypothetical protein
VLNLCLISSLAFRTAVQHVYLLSYVVTVSPLICAYQYMYMHTIFINMLNQPTIFRTYLCVFVRAMKNSTQFVVFSIFHTAPWSRFMGSSTVCLFRTLYYAAFGTNDVHRLDVALNYFQNRQKSGVQSFEVFYFGVEIAKN